jgi:tetratricopeptide (TPR) repeat protein
MVCQQMRGRAVHCSRALIVALALVVLLDGTAEGANRGRGKGKAKAPQDTAAIGGGGAAAGPEGQTGQGLRPEDMWEWHDQSCGAALVEKFTGNYDHAVQMLGSLISQVPNVTATWLELGSIFGGVDDGALARRCLRTATRLDRHETKAAAALRDLRLHGRLPPLVPSLDLGGDGADPAAEHQSRYKRRLYERYYHLDCRMRRLQQTLNLNPRDVAALLGSAEVSSELLYHNEAVDMLERALVVEPSNGPVFVKLVEAQVSLPSCSWIC